MYARILRIGFQFYLFVLQNTKFTNLYDNHFPIANAAFFLCQEYNICHYFTVFELYL